jgi:arginine-tRNA-protein transferase
METLFHYVAEPSRCGYLPEQRWSLEYLYVSAMSRAEYLQRMLEGWRRFGTMLFRPACQACTACRSLRVLAGHFQPDRSQRRCRQANEGVVELRIGMPSVTRAKLALYDRYHHFQSESKGWPPHPTRDHQGYAASFVDQPFAVEEWCYYLGGQLVAVGYVDALEDRPAGAAGDERGLSGIYFFYEPQERQRSLGTWNVLCLLDQAVRRRLPFVYLGYYVESCRSMSYKPRFIPNQLRGTDGVWRDFRTVGGAAQAGAAVLDPKP